MKYTILVSPQAHKEIEEAHDFYEEKREGLGNLFLDEISAYFNKLVSSPLSYSFIDNSKIVRDICLDRFPFVIVFVVTNLDINVMSVRHTLKKPFFG